MEELGLRHLRVAENGFTLVRVAGQGEVDLGLVHLDVVLAFDSLRDDVAFCVVNRRAWAGGVCLGDVTAVWEARRVCVCVRAHILSDAGQITSSPLFSAVGVSLTVSRVLNDIPLSDIAAVRCPQPDAGKLLEKLLGRDDRVLTSNRRYCRRKSNRSVSFLLHTRALADSCRASTGKSCTRFGCRFRLLRGSWWHCPACCRE